MSGSAVAMPRTPWDHSSPSTSPSAWTAMPRSEPTVPVSTNPRSVRHQPMRCSATPTSTSTARSETTSSTGPSVRKAAVAVVHQWPRSTTASYPVASSWWTTRRHVAETAGSTASRRMTAAIPRVTGCATRRDRRARAAPCSVRMRGRAVIG
ncbi:hypothetical protein BC477_15005 [Clavibacter michiganensis subsp. michiganensis]|uniref:Uncharacterized protein n=1 Tax=Clavibacter michiganensis subsp. michiganensis TaxID=33013 RepID=A0A251XCS7_CLAMM|nr:hypothetical protein BC477_15005 [Clavibacter michiganensis subsp. michiganensis]OUD99852.1 hypothetical protein CMMCAS07_20470 [Clavibacter michiganensis subsp. michiganensis]